MDKNIIKPPNLIGISGKKNSGKDLVGEIIRSLIWHFKTGGSVETFNSKHFNTLHEVYQHEHLLLEYSKFKVKKFAEGLKQVASIILNCSREQFEDETFKNKILGEEWWYYQETNNPIVIPFLTDFYKGQREYLKKVFHAKLIKPTVRDFLKKLGNEAGRNNVHPNIWVNFLMRDYNKYSHWIVTDIRFKNEARVIENNNGILIRINRGITFGNYLCSNCNNTFNSDNATFNHIADKNQMSCPNCGGINFAPFFLEIDSHLSEIDLDNYKFDFVIENNGTIDNLIDSVKQILITLKIIK